MSAYDDFRADLQPYTLVFFESASCAPCKAMKQVVIRAATRAGVPVRFFDVAQERATVQRLRLRAVPAVYVMSRGEERLLFTGTLSEEQVYARLTQPRPM